MYICRACERRFTSGPRGVRNKTYPVGEILDALTSYNQGDSLEDTARRLSSRYGHAINQFLNGSLDDARIYNRALSAAEVTALYQATGGQ